MKFLVINRHGTPGATPSPQVLKDYAAKIREMKEKGILLAAYAFLSGGHAYVVEASDTADLARKVRLNPIFGLSETEIIPVAEAEDFLEGFAAHLE